ncbi:MAG: D-tyrosyl-tRNA(Tyr) deacylase [Candidatus Micrarchaeota archaeon]|nr:D-tyrosyl-tRNA(Tyr) deacylase [Candidatus Micrarchaeota archaeon]
MRALVVISAQNEASQNIKERLLEIEDMRLVRKGFWSCEALDMAEYGGRIVEIVPSHAADYYIFASTHRSSSGMKGFSVHTPGNWGSAELGGEPCKLNLALPSKVKVAAQWLAKLSEEELGWGVSLEVDHHGPTLEKPLFFIEIGSSEPEWKNKKAGEIVARSIIEAAKSKATFPTHIAFGGTHYCPRFTPLVVEGELAFGHIISGYDLERWGASDKMVKEAWEKNVEKPKSALLDWKGIKGGVRQELILALERQGISWAKA